ARRPGEGAERARTAATRSSRYAIERIAEHHRALGDHLQRSIRTGTYCAYEPEPTSRAEWQVE
ncbi:MAG: hypothetical protein OXR73_37585, partial [Myxococcales bacterium]|nr:hypothetical protein [Myxococcales bacterium]